MSRYQASHLLLIAMIGTPSIQKLTKHFLYLSEALEEESGEPRMTEKILV